MNEESSNRINVADGITGIQANGDVYDSTVYIVQEGDSPRKRYEVAVQHLEDGIPAQARELITDAITDGHDGGDVRFHLVLALLSKRAYRDLSPTDRQQLARTEEILDTLDNDEWKRSLDVVYELLACQRERSRNPKSALRRLRMLGDTQRQRIIRHLEHVLTGSAKDNLWEETRQAAEEDRESNDRLGSVWAYFEPKPIPPRAREPAADRTTFRDRALATGYALLATVSIGYLDWIALSPATLLLGFAVPLALAAGCAAAITGLEWYYHSQRLRTKDQQYLGRYGTNQAPEGGFANGVDRSFDYYFSKYVPHGTSREDWLQQTVGIRRNLRDEIAELYREQRIAVGRVNWLIRHLVGKVRKRWENGVLWQYREDHRIAGTTKLWCSASGAIFAASTLLVIATAVRTAPLPSAFATVIFGFAAVKSATRWLDIVGERRRLREEEQEYEQERHERRLAFERWREKLRSTRPSEYKMETWLSCDVTLLLNQALEHYRLAWRDVLAHAVLLTPSRGCQRARATHGLWRYTKYDVRLFLITQEGVRELIAKLDFSRAEFEIQARNNYRFDAVSSVYVAKTDDYSYELRLTLMNGPSHEIEVTGLGRTICRVRSRPSYVRRDQPRRRRIRSHTAHPGRHRGGRQRLDLP